jgi:hypothetical protein
MLVSLLLIPMAAAPQIRGGQSVEVLSVDLGTAVNSMQQGEYSEWCRGQTQHGGRCLTTIDGRSTDPLRCLGSV